MATIVSESPREVNELDRLHNYAFINGWIGFSKFPKKTLVVIFPLHSLTSRSIT